MNRLANHALLHHHGNYQVWRIRLAPGEATHWHRDPYQLVTVVLEGDELEVEFRGSRETHIWKLTPGEVAWSEPSDRPHRAINVGSKPFAGVTTFFLNDPEEIAQPTDD